MFLLGRSASDHLRIQFSGVHVPENIQEPYIRFWSLSLGLWDRFQPLLCRLNHKSLIRLWTGLKCVLNVSKHSFKEPLLNVYSQINRKSLFWTTKNLSQKFISSPKLWFCVVSIVLSPPELICSVIINRESQLSFNIFRAEKHISDYFDFRFSNKNHFSPPETFVWKWYYVCIKSPKMLNYSVFNLTFSYFSLAVIWFNGFISSVDIWTVLTSKFPVESVFYRSLEMCEFHVVKIQFVALDVILFGVGERNKLLLTWVVQKVSLSFTLK